MKIYLIRLSMETKIQKVIYKIEICSRRFFLLLLFATTNE